MTLAAPASRPTIRTQPRFLRVWGSQSAGALADQILPVALSLYVIRQGGGAGAVATILAGRAVALVVCLLAGGVLADRVSRTRILLAADVLRAVAVLTTVLVLDRLPLAALALVTAGCGAAEALSRPALRSLVPALLPDRLLERGNAFVSAVHRGSAMLGALVGAALVAAIGTPAALVAAGVLFALGALAVAGVPDTATAKPTGGVLADAASGLREVRRRPWVVAVMSAVAVQLFAGTAPALVLLPLIAERDFGGELAYGVVLAALAAGALPAIAVAGRWRPRRPGLVGMLALTAYAALPLSLAVPLPLPVTAACFAVGGFTVELYFVYWLSALQRAIPAGARGKVLALDQLSAYALLPIGYALTGPLVAVLGDRTTLLAAAVVTAAATALTLLVPGVSRFADPGPEQVRAD
ncbi:MFS transporter [Micromonospora sp. WMMD882]|uniref:MFS transporter n=1 Tax=Micromonospora sp. WMMD882 TaxID=3015151 RepID=UPI00248CC220|nr:MFS transporter [Micromonospora sp. WMMD882]WBB78171.1 MFS transporter [Micromonospora sp. WMMD882]